MTLVIHLIDFSHRNSWLESHFPIYSQKGIGTGLISISSEGPIHNALRFNGFENIKHFNRGIRGFLSASLTLKRWAKREKVYIYAHGHIPSIYAMAFKFFIGTKFVICHHQQPEFFSNLMKRGSLKAKLHLYLAQIYYRDSTYIQSFSPEVTRSLTKRRVPFHKIVEIPLGVKFDNFPKLSLTKPTESGKALNIVSIGRLVWEKRIDLGILTVAELIKSGQLVHYQIVGDGPELGKLKSLAKDLKINRSVEFSGYRENINEILSVADIFFHLAVTESYGQVLLESRLCGTPIYTSAVGVALEMEELGDPMVRVFRTSDPRVIAADLMNYFKNVESGELEDRGPTMYSSHEFENVVSTVLKRIWIDGF